MASTIPPHSINNPTAKQDSSSWCRGRTENEHCVNNWPKLTPCVILLSYYIIRVIALQTKKHCDNNLHILVINNSKLTT
jgi:hypothetical protein